MKTGQGFVLAYSITSSTSFDAASKLRTHILRIKEETADVRVQCPIKRVEMVIGSVTDLYCADSNHVSG